ncbi:hypothetical protein Goari_021253, partial [Gossypium aridum]|nr:hypothetical protein [Gossypium aridum]
CKHKVQGAQKKHVAVQGLEKEPKLQHAPLPTRRLCRHEARKTSARTAVGLAGLLTEAKPYQILRYEPPKAKSVPWLPRTINVRSTNMKDKTGAKRHKKGTKDSSCQPEVQTTSSQRPKDKKIEDGDKRPSYSTDRMEKRNERNVKQARGSLDRSNEQRWLAR